jgi:hypothetical protein
MRTGDFGVARQSQVARVEKSITLTDTRAFLSRSLFFLLKEAREEDGVLTGTLVLEQRFYNLDLTARVL